MINSDNLLNEDEQDFLNKEKDISQFDSQDSENKSQLSFIDLLEDNKRLLKKDLVVFFQRQAKKNKSLLAAANEIILEHNNLKQENSRLVQEALSLKNLIEKEEAEKESKTLETEIAKRKFYDVCFQEFDLKKKQTERESNAFIRNIFLGLVSILDTLDIATKSINEISLEKNPDASRLKEILDSIKEGQDALFFNLTATLKKNKITPIIPIENELFNPQHHSAISFIEVFEEEEKEPVINKVFRNGYIMLFEKDGKTENIIIREATVEIKKFKTKS